jgi:hypothetical protein
MKAKEALKWVFEIADEEFLQPWKAWSDYNQQITAYHCWGCGGAFISKWPEWEKPTDNTFPHSDGCMYMAAKRLNERPEVTA